MSRVRQNYSEECEEGVNKQINLEMYAMNTYLSMSYHFDRADVALPNFAEYFKKAAHEKLEHAEKFMKFQNKRGGTIVSIDIRKPSRNNWGAGLDAINAALSLEREINDALLNLITKANSSNDYQMSDFVESNFLHKQVDTIKELADHVTNLERVGTGHGEYHFERESLS